jgi:hypothetical protein
MLNGKLPYVCCIFWLLLGFLATAWWLAARIAAGSGPRVDYCQ